MYGNNIDFLSAMEETDNAIVEFDEDITEELPRELTFPSYSSQEPEVNINYPIKVEWDRI